MANEIEQNKARSTINEHILNAYKEGEIEGTKTMRKIGNSDFSTKPTNYYNLDVIISGGNTVTTRCYPLRSMPRTSSKNETWIGRRSVGNSDRPLNMVLRKEKRRITR